MVRARDRGIECWFTFRPLRCLVANAIIWALGLRDRTCVVCGDMFAFDISQADVVTLYLLPGTNQRIKPHLSEGLRPGARVVSHAFTVAGWPPALTDVQRRLFVYEVGRPEQEDRLYRV